MRRWLVILVAANALVLAWWQGHLSPLWDPPGSGEREPLRMARQMRPEAVRVEPARPRPPAAVAPGADAAVPAASAAAPGGSAAGGPDAAAGARPAAPR